MLLQIDCLIHSKKFHSASKHTFLYQRYIVNQITGNSYMQRSNVGSFNSHRIVAVVARTAGELPKSLVHCCDNNLAHDLYSLS
jgi:hypothetical protein